jgi:hypothetical protein
MGFSRAFLALRMAAWGDPVNPADAPWWHASLVATFAVCGAAPVAIQKSNN